MAKRKSTPERKSRSGPTQSEEDRDAKQIKLRLLPSAQRELRRRAKVSGLSMSAVVSALLMATTPDRCPDADR